MAVLSFSAVIVTSATYGDLFLLEGRQTNFADTSSRPKSSRSVLFESACFTPRLALRIFFPTVAILVFGFEERRLSADALRVLTMTVSVDRVRKFGLSLTSEIDEWAAIHPTHVALCRRPWLGGYVRGRCARRGGRGGRRIQRCYVYISYLGTDRPRSSMNFFRSTMYHG
jgi:hypothetical protein